VTVTVIVTVIVTVTVCVCVCVCVIKATRTLKCVSGVGSQTVLLSYIWQLTLA